MVEIRAVFGLTVSPWCNRLCLWDIRKSLELLSDWSPCSFWVLASYLWRGVMYVVSHEGTMFDRLCSLLFDRLCHGKCCCCPVQIEHFVDPKDKKHPKFSLVADNELVLFGRVRTWAELNRKKKIGDRSVYVRIFLDFELVYVRSTHRELFHRSIWIFLQAYVFVLMQCNLFHVT